ncbi:PAS domain S-box protein [Mariprofundus sp. EBB-1]|uniref:two-component system sensor histidine kinase NtrB n=1 Tax=Mariprofundus sp. EBB-1 TaxID=2650971 RepID=UPI000EF17E17|nr:ATP-binding protein [Mariprofundus sp. EBB-1]RLL52170.1 PAS domain S-box protein [Mariprofundus sp. EBB-1]
MNPMSGDVEQMRISLLAAEKSHADLDEQSKTTQAALLQALDDVKKEHELIERLLSAMPSILIAVDHNGIISLWNDVAEKVFGLSRKEVTGTAFSTLAIAWDWDEIHHALSESKASYTSSMDHVKFNRNDGTDGFLGLTINAVIEHGQYNGFLLVGADKTTRMQLENQLQMSQRMESMGELAAGIAHEINTPMQYIGDNVRFLKDGFNDILQLISTYQLHMTTMKQENMSTSVQQLTETLQQAEEKADLGFLREEVPLAVAQTLEGIAHVSKIVGAMKELSHPGTGDKMPIDINKMIESAVTVSRNEWKYVADLDVTFDPELPMIHALPEINQVFLNIIVNAAHAIADTLPENSDEKGRIHIQTCHSNEFVEIHINDSGSGIEKDKLDKIFNPFFTTKEPGKGTGQGLAISHQIVCNRLDGQLSVKSEPGKGAHFTIKLPIGNT